MAPEYDAPHVPGTPSGLVLDQEPSADTSAVAEGEVRVVLSGQPAPATLNP
jgi:beta-lactam-binding protein with PASTA domain